MKALFIWDRKNSQLLFIPAVDKEAPTSTNVFAMKSNFFLQPSRTQCKMEVRILSGGVTKNLTLHGMSKIDFQPDFRNGLMLSFLLMYNTMGSKVNGLAVREHFL